MNSMSVPSPILSGELGALENNGGHLDLRSEEGGC
jgi:hypothetical protein